jgi:hypothetical protein
MLGIWGRRTQFGSEISKLSAELAFWHFSLAGPARTGHNALQWSTPDEAATKELEPSTGRTDMVMLK